MSALGLGCWAIGGPWTFQGHPAGWGQVDDDESIRAIHCALDTGVNLFDTAANYGCGHSERILGSAVKGRRDRVILATKFGYAVDEDSRNVTDRTDVVGRIHQDCEASLRRLQTDYIDLYQFHVNRYDPGAAVPVRDMLEALVREGKIRWYGWSTDNPAGAEVFVQGPHCTAIQHEMNWMYEPASLPAELLEVCQEHDQASIIRSPFGGSFLTGTLRPDSTFPEDDRRHTWDLSQGSRPERLQKVDNVRAAFAQEGRTPVQVALGWIWARSERTIPIPGFRTVGQVKENIAALELGPLSGEQMKRIDAILGRAPVA